MIIYQISNKLFLKQAFLKFAEKRKKLYSYLSTLFISAYFYYLILIINILFKKALKILSASVKSKYTNKIFSGLIIFSIGINSSIPQIINIQIRNIDSKTINSIKFVPFKKTNLKTINKGKTYLINENTLIKPNFLNSIIKEKPKQLEKKAEKTVRTETVNFTAYSSTVSQCDGDPFTTASGSRVRDGVTAANFLPFGTKFKIPEIFGNKIFVVEDRMAKRYWKTVDIWMPNYKSAINFGKKYGTIEILSK